MVDIKTIQDFFIVLMAVLGFISVIGGVINLFRSWIKDSPTSKHSKHLTDIDNKIDNHEDRIVALEAHKEPSDDGQKVLFNSILAIISHELNGNSTEKLSKAKDELEEYLIKK